MEFKLILENYWNALRRWGWILVVLGLIVSAVGIYNVHENNIVLQNEVPQLFTKIIIKPRKIQRNLILGSNISYEYIVSLYIKQNAELLSGVDIKVKSLLSGYGKVKVVDRIVVYLRAKDGERLGQVTKLIYVYLEKILK